MPHIKDDVVIVGDGPAGLTCALFLAKNGLGVHVLGMDETAMHKAMLHNFPGRPDTTGTQLTHDIRRQAEAFGAHLHKQHVTSIRRNGPGFHVATSEGNGFEGRYVVLATGLKKDLAVALGLEVGPNGVKTDGAGRTSMENVYASGWLSRGHATQAVISAGDGTAVALDILAKEKGKPFHDFDVVQAPGHLPSEAAKVAK
jgi:thioredoxin reductase